MSTIHERRLARMPSASGVVSASDFKSPLAQVRSLADSLPQYHGDPGPSTLHHLQRNSPPSSSTQRPVPPLDFNLFRSNSVYSVSSINTLSSFDTYTDTSSSDAHGAYPEPPESESEFVAEDDIPPPPVLDFSARAGTPTTPKAERTYYFDLGPPITAGSSGIANVSAPSTLQANGEGLNSGEITPKRSFVFRSRQGHHPVSGPAPPEPVFSLSASSLPSSRSLADTHRDVFSSPSHRDRSDSLTRAGEVPVALPHRESIGSKDWESIHGEQGSEWGEDEAGYEWLDKDGAPAAVNGQGEEGEGGRGLRLSPSKRLARIRGAVPGFGGEGGGGAAGGGKEGRKLKKHIVIPRRAAPPPPPGPGSPRQIPPQPLDRALSSTSTIKQPEQHPRPCRVPPAPDITHQQNLQPTMVPLSDISPSRPKATHNRASGLSIQSTAFSLYDLDGSGSSANTPRATTPSGGDMVFPKGTYTRVPISALNWDASGTERRVKKLSDPPKSPLLGMRDTSRDDLLDRGVEARAKGDLPKAAWYFRQAADAGSTTGRIYWGLALRHGWGIARDERKAFVELRQACDESISHGSTDIPALENSNLSINQKKAMARDISLGIFEVANCFLDGVGVKKDAGVAISYLRFAGDLGDLAAQEQLGFLLSKGGNGVKKDMKEAAKWYRMAIGQGSTSIGLAWVWKDKYMV